MSLASLIKRLQDIMRKDSGVDGDAQRLAQIVWLIFLKVYDYKEEEAELDDDYVPVIPKGYRWRDWAVGTSVKEQMTGPDLLDFVNNKLIPALGGNPITVDVPIDENGNEITDKAKMKFAKGYGLLLRRCRTGQEGLLQVHDLVSGYSVHGVSAVFRIEEQLRYEAVPDVRRYIRRLKRRQDDLYKISCQTHVR